MPTPVIPWIKPFHADVVTHRIRWVASFLSGSCHL
jgi:hypothetical protein